MSDDRLIDAVRAVVLSLLPNLTYLGFYRYSVDTWHSDDQTFDGRPVDASKGLPNITKVPVRTTGIATVAPLQPGETVLIGFEDGNPTLPFVAHLGYPTGSALPIARQGDLVSTGVKLAPVITWPGGSPTPDPTGTMYVLVFDTPPPPPFVPGVGGPATLTGVTSSGSTRNKTL